MVEGLHVVCGGASVTVVLHSGHATATAQDPADFVHTANKLRHHSYRTVYVELLAEYSL
jgi:hypothetical protein